MMSSTWLRISAGFTVFLAAGHTFGAVLASPSHGAGESALRDAMRTFRVTEMGMERSYWDFYFGSGWTITALLVASAAVMWWLAPVAKQSPSGARPLILALAGGYAAVTVISALYFVTAPIVVAALITMCLGGAERTATSFTEVRRHALHL